MGKEAKEIRETKNIILNADKTQNRYSVSTTEYKQLLNNTITKDYKLDKDDNLQKINREICNQARSLKIEDRIECHSEAPAFISVKDHKEGFQNNPKCRLINPSSNQLGKASKLILEDVIKKVKKKSGVSQWISTQQLLSWFQKRHEGNPTPKKAALIQFDIAEFYPSITEELMDRALENAKSQTDILPEHVEVIKACRKSVLFSDSKVWRKKNKDFDITMGALDGAEAADLVGIYLLQQIQKYLESNHDSCFSGLYRDDGLIYINNSNGPLLNRIEKQLHQIFKNNGMKITVEQVGKIVNILDVTLNSETGSFKPFRKPNSNITYVNKSSNHPPVILSNIPRTIQDRLCNLSHSEKEFDECKGVYQEALKKAGYKSDMKYTKRREGGQNQKKKRQRKIIWFNPPFSKNVATDIGKNFFDLLRLHFPPQHPFHRLFNAKTVKLSYSTMMNMDSIVKATNKKLLKKAEERIEGNGKECNCRKAETCPVEKKCLTTGVVYEATVKHGNKESRYVGMTEGTFKSRLNTHKTTLRHDRYRTETELSKLVWRLKDRDIKHDITWRLLAKAHTYVPGNIVCNLCLSEKFHILRGKALINRKSELLNKCPHKRKYLATQYSC